MFNQCLGVEYLIRLSCIAKHEKKIKLKNKKFSPVEQSDFVTNLHLWKIVREVWKEE